MWDKIYYVVMVPMVYAAFAVLILGIIFKIVLVLASPRVPGTRATFPKKLPRLVGIFTDAFTIPAAFRKAKLFWFFLIVYHSAFALLFIGHLELIREFKAIQVIPHEVFLGAGWVGIAVIVAVIYFLFRRFTPPSRLVSVPEDYILLLLLFLASIFGSHMHLAARYGIAGFDIPLDEGYRAYLGSMAAFRPELPAVITNSPHYVILVLHIFFANLFLMMFPFRKMIHSAFIFLSFNLKRK
jgi:nitrate reductase gamma subunit